MDLLLLVTLGRAARFPDRCPKSVLADVCLIDLWGWIPQKQMEIQLHGRHWCFLFLLYTSGVVIIPGKDFSGCP